jgi:hypothetical protein
MTRRPIFTDAAEAAEILALAAAAKADQVAAMAKAEAEGDSFAAYWAGSASASIMHHARRGAVVTIHAGRR